MSETVETTRPTPSPEDVKRAQTADLSGWDTLAREFAEVRAEERAACRKVLVDMMFACLGSGHPEGRAAAHRDARLIGSMAEKLDPRSSS